MYVSPFNDAEGATSPEMIQTVPSANEPVLAPDDDACKDADKPVLVAVNDVATLPVIVSGELPFTVLTDAVIAYPTGDVVALTVTPGPCVIVVSDTFDVSPSTCVN